MEALADKYLAIALRFLVGEDVEGVEGGHVPLFLCDDWQQVVNAMPTFGGSGLVQEVPPEGQEAAAPLELSSDDSHGGEEEDEEEEERDSEATTKETGEKSP